MIFVEHGARVRLRLHAFRSILVRTSDRGHTRRKILARDVRAWMFALVAALVTIIVRQELPAIFVVSALLGLFVFPDKEPVDHCKKEMPRSIKIALIGLLFLCALGLALYILDPNQLLVPIWFKQFLFFFRTGLMVFGSGLVIVPFLKQYVVDQYAWINQRQFLDSVAIGLVTPGPVVITATFVGYLCAGIAGAFAATVGIFSPSVLFTLTATPILNLYQNDKRVKGIIRGISASVAGVLAGTSVMLATSAIGDLFTGIVVLLSLTGLLFFRKIPEQFWIIISCVLGIVFFNILKPAWVLK